MKTLITPLKDNVLVSLEKAKAKMVGGIHMPDKISGFDGQAIVCFVGPEATGFHVGDRVAIPNSHGASKLTIGEMDYLVFKADQIIARINTLPDAPARSSLPPG